MRTLHGFSLMAAALLLLYFGATDRSFAGKAESNGARDPALRLKSATPAPQESRGPLIPCSQDAGEAERHYCEADTRHGAHLVRQTSQAPCKKDESWGYDEEGIWVDKGCSGEFALGKGEASSTARGEGGASNITCGSDDGRRKVCPADTSNGVQLVRQRSDAKCKEGASWGREDKGIWVDKGCGGDFVVGVPGHPVGSEKTAPKGQTISCASMDGKRNYCEADTQGAEVRLTRQLGMAQCIEGATWGFDRKGIWVDRFCNGEFQVQPIMALGVGDASGKNCVKTVGKQVAEELVRRCLQVSTLQPTPCKAENSCKLMEDEIQRACEKLGAKAPAFCSGEQ